MTKVIEETLNLPSIEEALANMDDGEDDDISPEELEMPADETIKSKMIEVDDLRRSIQKLRLQDVTLDDSGIEDIKERALEAYKDMLEAGFAADTKHASNFLEPAVQSLSIALETENLKMKKRIEYYRLKLQEDKLDLLRRKIEMEEKKNGQGVEIIDENSVLMDRNELLKQLIKNDK